MHTCSAIKRNDNDPAQQQRGVVAAAGKKVFCAPWRRRWSVPAPPNARGEDAFNMFDRGTHASPIMSCERM